MDVFSFRCSIYQRVGFAGSNGGSVFNILRNC